MLIMPVRIEGANDIHALDVTDNEELPETTLCGLLYQPDLDTILSQHNAWVTCEECKALIPPQAIR